MLGQRLSSLNHWSRNAASVQSHATAYCRQPWQRRHERLSSQPWCSLLQPVCCASSVGASARPLLSCRGLGPAGQGHSLGMMGCKGAEPCSIAGSCHNQHSLCTAGCRWTAQERGSCLCPASAATSSLGVRLQATRMLTVPATAAHPEKVQLVHCRVQGWSTTSTGGQLLPELSCHILPECPCS